MTKELEEANLKRITARLCAALERLPPGYDGGTVMSDLRTLLSAVDGDGWVLVPREPTEAMQEAGGRSIAHPSVYMGGAGPNRRKLAAQYYRDMIAASPPVPEGGE